MIEIPQELIDATIDCLDSDDYHRSALVARSWVQRSQGHIFRTVTLGVGIQGSSSCGLMEMPPLGSENADFNNFAAFLHLLQESPHLGSHVKSLVLGLPPGEDDLDEDTKVLCSACWEAIEACVVAILPLLRSLESLALFPCGPDIHTFHLLGPISDVFAALMLKTLHLWRWDIDNSSVVSCFQSSRISSLHFIECDFNTPVGFMECIHPPSFLTLHDCHWLDIFCRFWIDKESWEIDGMKIYMSSDAMVLQALTCLAPFIRQKLTIVFEAGSGFLIASDRYCYSLRYYIAGLLFSHIPTLHLAFVDTCTAYQTDTIIAWLRMELTSVVLKRGMTICLSHTTTGRHSNTLQFETQLERVLRTTIPTLRLRSTTPDMYFNSEGHIFEYFLVSAL
ncbi:hypothetical protein C8R45DRAFT_933933 [Mycena sanguinolenta]|nr:hypothetical protein C8R45DRAFT_933933 [Mycena sanguinolenta]